MLAILRSNPGKRRRYLVISIGSKVPFRSRRMSRATLPLSGARSSGGSRCADWRAGCAASEAFSARSSSRWTSICVLSPRSASALVSAARMQIWPKRSPAEPPSGRRPSRSRSGLIRGAHPRDVITSVNKIQGGPGARGRKACAIIAGTDAKAVIPSSRSGQITQLHNAIACRQRSSIKYARRFAPRDERRTIHFAGFDFLTVAAICLSRMSTTPGARGHTSSSSASANCAFS